jgi:hypothetical protein
VSDFAQGSAALDTLKHNFANQCNVPVGSVGCTCRPATAATTAAVHTSSTDALIKDALSAVFKGAVKGVVKSEVGVVNGVVKSTTNGGSGVVLTFTVVTASAVTEQAVQASVQAMSTDTQVT